MKPLLQLATVMCFFIYPKICEAGFDRNRTIVVFDPNVSLLEDFIDNNLTDSHILPLIEKVSSTFSKIYLNYRPKYHTMTAAVIRATANFNKLKSNKMSSSLMKIWLRFDPTDEHLSPEEIIDKLQILVCSANIIYPGTVEVILLPGSLAMKPEFFSLTEQVRAFFCSNNNNQSVSSFYKFGLEFDDYECRKISNLNFNHSIDIFVVRGLNNQDYYEIGVHRGIVQLKKNFKSCLQHFRLRDTKKEIGFMTQWPDTTDYSFQNSSNLVHFWKSISDWAIGENCFVVFEEAFDRPVLGDTSESTRGWFRLIESSDYKNSTEYIFESKEESALSELRLKNLKWLQASTNFSKKLLVPGLNPVVVMSADVGCVSKCYSPLDTILGVVAQEFSSVYIAIVHEKKYNYGSVNFLKAVQSFNKKIETVQRIRLVIEFEYFMFDTPSINLRLPGYLIEFKAMLNETDLFESVETIIINTGRVGEPYIGTFRKYMDAIETTFLSPQLKPWWDERLAMSTNIFECLESPYFSERLPKMLNYTNTIYVYFSHRVTYCGEERYLNLKIFELESCEKRIIEIAAGHKNISILFGVNSPHPPDRIKNPSNFNGRMAVGSVHLWQGINKWATKRNSTVIMHNAFAETGHTLWQLYKIDENEITDLSYWFKDSRTEAIKWAKTFHVHADGVNGDLSPWQIFAATAAALVIAVFLAVSLWCFQRKFKSKQEPGIKAVDKIFDGDENEADNFYRVPYNKEKYEVSMEDFVLEDSTKPLGKGEFGDIFKCTIQRQSSNSSTEKMETFFCAVKINQSGTSEKARQALRGSISELKILQYLGEHENVILLIGANISEISTGKLYLFLELCELGSLLSYLRLRLSNEVENVSQNCYDQQDMIRWSQEIVNGMEYLASRKVVHADLAARNVLLTAKKQCKITDFGLSRRLQNYRMYQKKSRDPLPWRWMAPESLRFLEFTEKSDVWSFGVTLWEIFSYGSSPFPMHSWDEHFERRLNEGLRLPQPACDEKNMYEIMNNCWKWNANDRPDFSDLKEMLTHGIRQAIVYVDVAESNKNN